MQLKKVIHAAVVVAVFLLPTLVCSAQKEVSEFGAFGNDEISLKQCAFDKDADAVVLFDKATTSYNDYHNLVTQRRIRFKILKERGIERGNIHIRYYGEDKFESILGIEAVILSFDEQNKQEWGKLDRKSIFTKRLNKYYSEVSFAMPNVKVGSIIEYKYESQMEHYGGLREWIFQSDMPVMLSSYYLTILPNTEFAYTVYKANELPINVAKDKQNGAVLFEMENIPGLREEAYMKARRDYLQRVSFQFSGHIQKDAGGYGSGMSTTTKYNTTWKEVAADMLDNGDFGSQINKSIPGDAIIEASVAGDANQFAKMKFIYDYVRSHFEWDQIYSKYSTDGLKSVWEKKTGSAGDINLMLINLLKSAGLPVQPMLVSDRNFGKIDTSYPYIDQFDKVVAYVTINGKSYILDGTNLRTPASAIPFDLLNTIGFVVDKKKPTLIKISDDSKENTNTVTAFATVSDEGTMQLEAVVKSYDYAKFDKEEKYKRNKRKYEADFLNAYHSASLDTFQVEGLDADSLPLIHTVRINKYAMNKTGNYFLLNYNLFTGIDKNPFTTEQRFSDIDFGCKYSCSLTATFTLPQDLVPEALPKNVKMVLADKSMSMSRQVEQQGNQLLIGVRIRFNKTEYSPDDYPDIKAFYKQMVELLNEPVVLKAKS